VNKSRKNRGEIGFYDKVSRKREEAQVRKGGGGRDLQKVSAPKHGRDFSASGMAPYRKESKEKRMERGRKADIRGAQTPTKKKTGEGGKTNKARRKIINRKLQS